MPLEGTIFIYKDAAGKVVNTPECRQFLGGIAALGAQLTRSSAPVFTGQYRDSIVSGILPDTDVPTAGFGSNSAHWHHVEFGTITTQPHRTLTKAGMAISQKFVPKPKPK